MRSFHYEYQVSFALKLELISIRRISHLDSFWKRDWYCYLGTCLPQVNSPFDWSPSYICTQMIQANWYTFVQCIYTFRLNIRPHLKKRARKWHNSFNTFYVPKMVTVLPLTHRYGSSFAVARLTPKFALLASYTQQMEYLRGIIKMLLSCGRNPEVNSWCAIDSRPLVDGIIFF